MSAGTSMCRGKGLCGAVEEAGRTVKRVELTLCAML